MTITVIKPKKTGLQKIKRVAGYARVSIDRLPSAISLKVQAESLKKRITQNPQWADCGIFLDQGITGTKTNRPGFKALMEKCEQGKIDLIITKSISRFCRNTVDLLSTIRHLKDIGVEVYFDENNISTFTSDGELLITLLASVAQEESRSISENVLWSVQKKFQNGEGIPCNLLGYRWDGKEYHIVESEAETVRSIFDLYLTGLGPKAIARMLRQKGINGLAGSPMSYTSVCTILRQEKYCGESLLQKTFRENHLTHRKIRNHGEMQRYLVEGTHPAIISKETFEAVQAEIERRKNEDSLKLNTSKQTSIFTSKIKCCECGRSFRRKNKGDAKPYFYWVCGNRIDKRYCQCHSKSIPERVLYEATAEIFGSQEEFNAAVDHIEGGKANEMTFVMKDGTRNVYTWKTRGGKA